MDGWLAGWLDGQLGSEYEKRQQIMQTKLSNSHCRATWEIDRDGTTMRQYKWRIWGVWECGSAEGWLWLGALEVGAHTGVTSEGSRQTGSRCRSTTTPTFRAYDAVPPGDRVLGA